jgi:acetylornithine deacetylase/succinyl-diaminopimelate desuccinylase-like protein
MVNTTRPLEGMACTIKTKCPKGTYGRRGMWHAEVRIQGVRGVVHTTRETYTRKTAIKFAKAFIEENGGHVAPLSGS